MKNTTKILILVALIAASVFLYANIKTDNQIIDPNATSIEVIFENNSGETTNEFFLYFGSGTTPKSIPNIEANDTYVEKMNYKESQNEDLLGLFYYDYNNDKVDIILIDSFEKGYQGKVKIDIVDIDDNGLHILEIS